MGSDLGSGRARGVGSKRGSGRRGNRPLRPLPVGDARYGCTGVVVHVVVYVGTSRKNSTKMI
ncbi:MAG: hypothetical protein K6T30_06680, partial [Alicyclobacillus sp.]|nr:hypothetical protein [Alicyclobacillus sp.]